MLPRVPSRRWRWGRRRRKKPTRVLLCTHCTTSISALNVAIVTHKKAHHGEGHENKEKKPSLLSQSHGVPMVKKTDQSDGVHSDSDARSEGGSPSVHPKIVPPTPANTPAIALKEPITEVGS